MHMSVVTCTPLPNTAQWGWGWGHSSPRWGAGRRQRHKAKLDAHSGTDLNGCSYQVRRRQAERQTVPAEHPADQPCFPQPPPPVLPKSLHSEAIQLSSAPREAGAEAGCPPRTPLFSHFPSSKAGGFRQTMDFKSQPPLWVRNKLVLQYLSCLPWRHALGSPLSLLLLIPVQHSNRPSHSALGLTGACSFRQELHERFLVLHGGGRGAAQVLAGPGAHQHLDHRGALGGTHSLHSVHNSAASADLRDHSSISGGLSNTRQRHVKT